MWVSVSIYPDACIQLSECQAEMLDFFGVKSNTGGFQTSGLFGFELVGVK